jgi:hypothetical protein
MGKSDGREIFRGAESSKLENVMTIEATMFDGGTSNAAAKPEPMTLKSLADAVEMIRLDRPAIKRFNADKLTCEWFLNQFPPMLIGQFGFFGVPIWHVDYLCPGFVEVEKTDGTREIINLNRNEKIRREPAA